MGYGKANLCAAPPRTIAGGDFFARFLRSGHARSAPPLRPGRMAYATEHATETREKMVDTQCPLML